MSYVDNPFQSPAVLSFCPGILGLERGLIRAIGSIRTVAHVEIEAFAVENILAGMEAGFLAPAPIWTNLKTFDALPFRGKVHGIIGGYPCQPFSTAGTRKGTDDPRHLWPHIRRHIDAIKPVWCFFENVSGHLTLGFDQVYKDLSGMGYTVEAGIFTAEEVGAPHQRERLFILAILADACGAGIGGLGRSPGWRIGGKAIRQGDEKECAVWIESAGELADTRCAEWGESFAEKHAAKSGRIGLQRERQEVAGGSQQCGQELANTNGNGPGTDARNTRRPSEANEGEAQRKERDELQRQRGGGYAGHNGAAVGNANVERFEDIGRKPCRSEGRSECEGIWDTIADTGNEWPSGPGHPQQAWESPRTIEPPLGRSATRNGNGFDILYLNEVYAIYTADKTSAIEKLSELWGRVEQESDKWQIGRLYSFLQEEILLTGLHGKIQNRRLTRALYDGKNISTQKGVSMRRMWIEKPVGRSSQGREHLQQLRSEFADAMCILSYQITLAGRQEACESGYEQALQRLRENYQNAWWNVPEALSEIQKVWRPLSDQSAWQQKLERAYKGYSIELTGSVDGYSFREDLLRALGNSVVEQTAELAFRTLLRKHFN